MGFYFWNLVFLPQVAKPNPPPAPPPINIGNCNEVWTGDFGLFDLPESELANQLTMFAAQKFYNLTKYEFLGCKYEGKGDRNRAPNFISLREHLNAFQSWISHEIMRPDKWEDIKSNCLKFLRLAGCLYKNQNYFHAEIVYAAFDDPSISNILQHENFFTKKDDEALMKKVKRCSFFNFANLFQMC